ncbi:MAG: hypothetical protein O3C45_01520 [Bacteroidetes bacterium]|nr:hypothetical protein [Bacteroidota bacterium]MDA0873717.1 hypothetical protein [Bacteroidota bacterium]
MQHNKPEPLMYPSSSAFSKLFSSAERHRSVAHRHQVREAARYVFCIYHGIPVSGIREKDGELVVHCDADYIGAQASGMTEYVGMLVSGAIAVQIIFGGENREMVDAIMEAERVFYMWEGYAFADSGRFETLVQKASRHATLHLADPKMRSAIGSATRFLARMGRRVREEEVEELRNLVIRALR